VDRVQSRLALARELGATHVIDTSNFASLAVDLGKAIREIVPGGTNANFDTTGVLPIIDAGIQSLQPKGQMVLIGIVDGHMDIDLGKIMMVRPSRSTSMVLLSIHSPELPFVDALKATQSRPRYDSVSSHDD
jgi:Zn-dependent alcohol dehydrogenase